MNAAGLSSIEERTVQFAADVGIQKYPKLLQSLRLQFCELPYDLTVETPEEHCRGVIFNRILTSEFGRSIPALNFESGVFKWTQPDAMQVEMSMLQEATYSRALFNEVAPRDRWHTGDDLLKLVKQGPNGCSSEPDRKHMNSVCESLVAKPHGAKLFDNLILKQFPQHFGGPTADS